MPIVLGYWKIRGLAQPARLLLKYTGTEFEDKRYEQGDAPGYSWEAWDSIKNTLGLDFPNLPYLMDGDFKITQSNAVLRYIAEQHKLCGETPAERAVVAMLECQAMDFRNGFVRLCYNSDFDNLVNDYKKNVKGRIQRFSDYLGQRSWFCGDKITFVDFVLYELLDQHRLFDASLIDGHDNIKAFLARFEALPAIKAYMSSSEFLKWPVNNKIARWGGGGPAPDNA